MENKLWKKGLILGIIVMLFGVSVIPSTGSVIFLNYEQPDNVYVDDDFNESTPGWGYDHFDNIQDGVDAVNISGFVYIYRGSYNENVIIDRSMTIIGENEKTTVVDGGSTGSVISIFNSIVSVSGLKVQNSGSELKDSGIFVENSEVILSFLVIQNNQQGILLTNTENSEIYLTKVADNTKSGITLELNSRNNWIAGNTISNNNIGINLNFAKGNQITHYKDGADEIWNRIDNNNYGVYLLAPSEDNSLYHNNFMENNQNAYDEGTNFWDDGNRGNYWDDYTGNDSDEDGIGDTPYLVPGGDNQDNYPLMIPNGVDLEPPEVYITKPVDGHLYVNVLDILVFDIPIRFIILNTLIIGTIQIEVYAIDNITDINKVEFYINEEYKGFDDEAPFSWTWDQVVILFPYTIKVIAYDDVDNQASDTINVWKFF